MPRWPGGLHAASGSGTAYGYRPVRPVATPQEHYWRRTATELHAAATATQSPGAAAFVPPGPLLPLVAAAGPQAAGEQWAVDLILVQLQTTLVSVGVSSAPLVVQQIAAQQSGGVTFTPPPVVAQAWRCHASMAKPYLGWQTGKLLAQTTQGANDTLSVSGPVLTPGEVIAVVWYNWFPQTGSGTGFPWAVYQGTRFALSVT